MEQIQATKKQLRPMEKPRVYIIKKAESISPPPTRLLSRLKSKVRKPSPTYTKSGFKINSTKYVAK